MNLEYVITIERVESGERPNKYRDNELEKFEDRTEIYRQRIGTLPIPRLNKIIDAVNKGEENE